MKPLRRPNDAGRTSIDGGKPAVSFNIAAASHTIMRLRVGVEIEGIRDQVAIDLAIGYIARHYPQLRLAFADLEGAIFEADGEDCREIVKELREWWKRVSRLVRVRFEDAYTPLSRVQFTCD